ncbi:MAG: trimeric autotransporter adhesin [Candidatus Parcubacteria bacterium]|jgi:hypothetical protein
MTPYKTQPLDSVWHTRIRQALKNIKKSTARATVAFLLAAIVAVPSVHALTASDIEMLISLGIIPAEKAAAARAAVGTNTTGSVSCGTFSRNLTIGSTGSDVADVQAFLVAKGFMTLPAGVAKGYFGSLTQSSLARYQASAGIVPATGYFGPLTRAKIALQCVATPTNPTNPTNPTLSGGEADLSDYDSTSEYTNEDLEEGETAKVFAAEFTVEDADARLDRVDVRVEAVDQTNEDEPWNQLESIALYVNGRKADVVDVDDEDVWSRETSTESPSNSRAYEVRFTGLDIVLEEDEDVELVLEVTASDSIDDSDLTQSWKVWIPTNGIRATDGEGIQQYAGADDESKTFSIEVADNGDVSIRENDDDLDAAILIVDADDKSSSHEVFRFDIDADDAAVFLNTLTIVASTSDNNIEDALSEVTIEIDGDEYDYDSASTTANIGEYLFDFEDNGDEVLVDKDETVEVVVFARFNQSTGNYTTGTQVQFGVGRINGSTYGDVGVTAEGETTGDDAAVDGRQEGAVHTLRSTGVFLGGNNTSATVRQAQFAGDTERGIFEIEVTVTALEEDAYIPDSVGTSSNADAGFVVNITDTGVPFEGATTAFIASETAKTMEGGRHKIPEGTSARFTIRVELDPTGAAAGRPFGIELDTIRFAETSGGTLVDYTVPNESQFETNKVTID